MKRKATQLRLLPRTTLEPIRDDDALSYDDLTVRYRCRCRNTAETGIKLEAIACVKCGSPMKVQL